MSSIKKSILLTTIFIALAFLFPSTVRAATVRDVLLKYGITVEDNHDEIKAKLDEAKKEYLDTYNSFIKGLDSQLVKELAGELLTEREAQYNVGELTAWLDYCKLYMDTLVQKNYSLDLILEAEQDYIETSGLLTEAIENQEIIKQRRNSLSYYDQIVEKTATIEDVKVKEYVVTRLRYELSTTKNYGDIGDIRPPAPGATPFYITGNYGYRVNPFDTSKREYHNGLDIRASTSDTVKSIYGGKVIFAGEKGGFGNMVMVDHGEGFSSLYGHMSSISAKVGDDVIQGSVLGYAGSTGRSTAPHLHLGVYINGKPNDPAILFR